MYVRALSFVCRQEVEKEEIRRVYRSLVDTVGTIDGFLGSTLLMRENACNGMALIYWDSKEAAARAGTPLVEFLGEYAYHILDSPPDVHGYLVVENGIIPDPNKRD